MAEKKIFKTEFEVSGLPPPDIQWFKNGEHLVSDGRIKLETKSKTIHMLTIDSALLEDANNYTLKAKNDTGEIEYSFNLIVQSTFNSFHYYLFKLYINTKLYF